MLINNLAELLRTQDLGINRAGFAKKIGLNRETLSQILLGRTKNPGIYTVAKIADALEISLDELIGRKSPKSQETSKDFVMTNGKLFEDVLDYVLPIFKKKQKISLVHLTNCIQEIYVFSNKKGILDEEFAAWYMERYS